MTARGLASAVMLAAAALAAASCSLTRLAYFNAPFAYSNAMPMMAWMAGDYVELSDPQKDTLRKRLRKAFAWHRAQELPEYKRFLESLAAKSAEPVTVDTVRAAYGELRTYYNRTLERVLPDIADLLLQLDAEQLTQLERKFADDNDKLARDAVRDTPEDRRAKRAERFIENVEPFTGTLADSQRSLVTQRFALDEEMGDERLADRRYRQGQTLAMLRARVPREDLIAGLRRLLLDTDSWRAAGYQRKLRARDERMFETFAALAATLTREQRASVQERLRGFVRDIDEVIATQ